MTASAAASAAVVREAVATDVLAAEAVAAAAVAERVRFALWTLKRNVVTNST